MFGSRAQPVAVSLLYCATVQCLLTHFFKDDLFSARQYLLRLCRVPTGYVYLASTNVRPHPVRQFFCVRYLGSGQPYSSGARPAMPATVPGFPCACKDTVIVGLCP